MENKIIKYGLRLKKTNKLVGYHQTSNEGSDFCNDNTTTLTDYDDNIWSVDNALIAEYVKNFSTEWYNARYETPKHNFEPDELEVIKLEITTSIEPTYIKIPTIEEYLEIKYKETNPKHYEYCIDQLNKRYSKMEYSLYDLEELIEEGKWNQNK